MIRVDSIIKVKHPLNPEHTTQAKVRRIGERHGSFHMLTLDINGQAAYAVAHSSEVSHG